MIHARCIFLMMYLGILLIPKSRLFIILDVIHNNINSEITGVARRLTLIALFYFKRALFITLMATMLISLVFSLITCYSCKSPLQTSTSLIIKILALQLLPKSRSLIKNSNQSLMIQQCQCVFILDNKILTKCQSTSYFEERRMGLTIYIEISSLKFLILIICFNGVLRIGGIRNAQRRENNPRKPIGLV